MRKLCLLFLLLTGFCSSGFSQRSEIGLFAGTSYYLGDLNPRTHFGNPGVASGIVYRYNFDTRWVFKLDGIIGGISGDDASSVGFDKQRNLSFKSKVVDISTQIELNFFNYYTGSGKYFFSPYIFTGLGFFTFNPKAEYEGEWFELQPLNTEGQGTSQYPGRDAYHLTQFAIPFGIGLKLSMTKYFCIGVEWGMRKTYTDYLDDVSQTYPDMKVLKEERGTLAVGLSDRSIDTESAKSVKSGMQRGDPGNKDWYSFAGVFITAKIYTKKQKGCRDMNNKPRAVGFEYD